MSSWEELFISWAQGPGKTEQEKCENTETAIRKAISKNTKLADMDIAVIVQGSYRAHTNVKQDSDVDICVRLNTIAFCDYPPGKTAADYDRIPSELSFAEYKNLIDKALIDYFGMTSVKRGNKAFDIHANAYRVDADVLPAFEHRRYYEDGSNRWLAGIAFKTDKGELFKNWPDQNYENGVRKNEETSRSYKRVIRILKRLRNKMQDDHIAEANDAASFLIECLIWNVPNEDFKHDTYSSDVRHALAHTFNATLKDDACKEWGEVNELKYLFRSGQPWTRERTHAFLSAAWDYIGLK